MNRRALLFAGALLLSGCATSIRYAPPDPGMVALEPLLAVVAGRDRLVVRLMSNGCTSKEGLAVFVERRGGGFVLAVARRRVDSCKAVPRPVDVEFSYAELGLPRGARVVVLNPLTAR
ncbi:MAG: hypothetical protein Q8L66_00155 [Caulobacter sp.]|nr:hypothetical protein [Caulobacter sp.]